MQLKADANFRTASDPVRVEVMRIICFPACERHIATEGISSRTDATLREERTKPCRTTQLPFGGVNGEVQRNGATMLSAA